MDKLLKTTFKTTKAKADIGVGLLFIAFSLFMLLYGIKKWASVSFGSVGIVTDRLFPYIVMIVMLAMSVCILVLGLFDLKQDRKRAAAGQPVAEVEFSIFALLVFLLGLFVIKFMKLLGYPLTVAIVLLAAYYMLGGRKLWQGLLVSIGFAAVSYLFFAVYLGVSLRLGFGL